MSYIYEKEICILKTKTFEEIKEIEKMIFQKTTTKYQTPIHLCCQNKNINSIDIDYFLGLGIPIESKDDKNNTAFNYLCKNVHASYETFQKFFKYSIDINNLNTSGNSGLRWLCRKRSQDLELIEMFLQKGADPNICDSWGRSCLAWALWVDTSKNENKNKNKNENNSAINKKLIKLLLKYGADPLIKDELGNNFLHRLCEMETIPYKLIKLVLDRYNQNLEKNILDQQNDEKNLPIHLLCMNPNSTAEIFKLFFASNEPVITRNKNMDLYYPVELFLMNNKKIETNEQLLCLILERINVESKVRIQENSFDEEEYILEIFILCLKYQPKINYIKLFTKNYPFLKKSLTNLSGNETKYLRLWENLFFGQFPEMGVLEHLKRQFQLNFPTDVKFIGEIINEYFSANNNNLKSDQLMYFIRNINEIKILNTIFLQMFIQKNIDLNIIKYLINEKNVDPYVKDDSDYQCLHYLLMNGNPDFKIFNYLLKHYPDQTRSLTEYGSNALTIVITTEHKNQSNFEKIIKLLLKNGSTLESTYLQKNNLLSQYLWYQKKIDLNFIGYLKRQFNNQRNQIKNLLNRCKKHPITFEELDYLITDIDNINKQNDYQNTALHYYCKESDVDTRCLDLFLKAGADLNLANSHGNTCLMCYFGNKNFNKNSANILKWFIKNGIEIKTTNEKNYSLAHFICHSSFENQLQRIVALFNNGLDINIANYQKMKPLHVICTQMTIPFDFINFIIQNDSNINDRNVKGRTPLHLITRNILLLLFYKRKHRTRRNQQQKFSLHSDIYHFF
ncbi:ankyrin repeat-containing protein [Anaeramoeba flamelloides]|uniref:Ankyrin repeat-containing protein n=1 Tax=Anaeramoeba flamelloides TaxID=1746091 RepID=A0AAV7YUF5_9EUKA|nr:ankyrin repeat-containing protein [Anaeramoeba flamelloides]